MAKLTHEPISTPESFNKESDRLGWPVILVSGLLPPQNPGGEQQQGLLLVKRDTRAWVLACADPQLAATCAVWYVESHT